MASVTFVIARQHGNRGKPSLTLMMMREDGLAGKDHRKIFKWYFTWTYKIYTYWS